MNKWVPNSVLEVRRPRRTKLDLGILCQQHVLPLDVSVDHLVSMEMGQTLGQEGWEEVVLVLRGQGCELRGGGGTGLGWAGEAVPLQLGARSPGKGSALGAVSSDWRLWRTYLQGPKEKGQSWETEVLGPSEGSPPAPASGHLLLGGTVPAPSQ